MSFPLRERGLKLLEWAASPTYSLSFPLRERGLKHLYNTDKADVKESFPLRERGLKRESENEETAEFCRSPCGNVD